MKIHMKRKLVVQDSSGSLKSVRRVSQGEGAETLKRSARSLREELQIAF